MIDVAPLREQRDTLTAEIDRLTEARDALDRALDVLDGAPAKPSPPPPPRKKAAARRSAPAGDFECSECGQKFSRPQGLSRHLSQTHGIRPTPPKHVHTATVGQAHERPLVDTVANLERVAGMEPPE